MINRHLLSRSRFFQYLAALAVLVLACVSLGQEQQKKERVAFIQFANESADSSLDWLAPSLVDCISRGLGAVKEITAVDYSSTVRALTEMNMLSADLAREENAAKVGKRLGADIVIIGNYKRSDTKIAVTVEILRIAGEKVARTMHEAPFDADFTLLPGKVGLLILEKLGIKASDTSYLVKKPTESAEALELYGKGLIFQKSEKTYDKAIESFVNAAKKDQKFAPPHFHLGCLYAITDIPNSLTSALKEYLKATSIDPDYAEAFSNLGVIYTQLGHAEQALQAYNSAIEKNPGLADAHCNLGKLLDSQGKHDDSIKEYNTAIKLSPNDAVLYNNVAVAYINKGNKEEAEKAYLKAVELNPDLKEAHLGLGLIYDNQNQKDKAILHYEMYLSLGGDDAEIVIRLQQLQKAAEKEQK
jgi:tetratricopeptide (TPR) repeat protein